jgi:hypothetical protein
MLRLMVRSQVSTTRWDYLTTFSPPEHLSIEEGQTYFEKIEIKPGTTEYEFVANKFNSTFNGRIDNNLPAGVSSRPKKNSMFAPGTFNVNNNYGGGGFGAMPLPAPYLPPVGRRNPAGMGAANIFGPGMGMGMGRGDIIKIEKIYNCVIYEKFITEFKRMLKKYPNLKIDDILKHMFHGSRDTEPHLIYGSEAGLDFRFSNSGMYGRGIYFADNS